MKLTPLADIVTPPPFSPAKYRRDYAPAHAKRIKETRALRGGQHGWMTDAKYLSIPIVGVDGEGVTRDDGSHDYIMLAILGAPSLRNPDNAPLNTAQILDYLWRTLDTDALNVIYGGSYDFNMWVKGLPADKLRALYKGDFLHRGVQVGDYLVKWSRGKSFTIKRGNRAVVIYDVVSFFQCTFVEALDTVLKKYEGRDFLIAQKKARGVFDPANADEISRYNNLEVELLARLVGTLRGHLNEADLRPGRWYGPGAIASALYSRQKIKQYMARVPDAVAKAARFAYAGGRFEMFKYGSVNAPVFEYDLNSAYPAAMQDLPSLAHGHWTHHDAAGPWGKFTLYRIRSNTHDIINPNPFFYRARNGGILYPAQVETWVWAPEYRAGKAYIDKYGGELEVLEVWEFVPDPGAPKPFAFVPTLYAKRQIAKALKQGVQIAYKLCLNSLYGKLAQQVGWRAATSKNPARIPPFHQLEWAGYITSYCRAKILDAITADRDAIIAVETDALFSTRPLPLPLNDGLGAWKEEVFDDFTYVQSGHYYARQGDEQIIKCRGIDKGEVTRADVEALLQAGPLTLPAPLTRFYGAGIALSQNMAKWCRWETVTKQLALYPMGKRLHLEPCEACTSDTGLGYRWHQTIVPMSPAPGISHEYPIGWINPDPLMDSLEEMRKVEVEWDEA